MFATPHSLLRELRVVVRARADDHKLDLGVCEELICSTVVFRIWKIDSTVLANLDTLLISRCFGALQESINFQVSIRGDEWQMEAFGGEAIAHKANFNWSHGFKIAN
jgi:hypothetical protein